MNLQEAQELMVKLELLLKLQNLANESSSLDVKAFVTKFVEENE